MITLRILTRKSKVGVGSYAGQTVERMLAAKRHRALRHIYYTYEGITFQDDILDEIHVTHRIAKPGSAPHLERFNNMEMENRRTFFLQKKYEDHGDSEDLARYKAVAVAKKKKLVRKSRKESLENASERSRIHLSKARLQDINHGHQTFGDYAPMKAHRSADTVRAVLRKTARGNILAAIIETHTEKGFLCFFDGTKVRRRRLTREYLKEHTTPVLSAEGQGALTEARRGGFPKITVIQRL